MSVMNFIAGWFPLASFVAGFVIYYFTRRAWIVSILVFGLLLGAMIAWYSMKFWPWLLLYLLLSWFGCWCANRLLVRKRVAKMN